ILFPLSACIAGYGLLESGIVSRRNEVNILVKNGANLALGGITYWIFGYALSFGTAPGTNPVFAWGYWGEFFLNSETGDTNFGFAYSKYVFQLAYATTATTLVSGAMAERCNFSAYCVFCALNTLVYCIPAGWVWGPQGFLRNLGVVDVGGSGVVHLCGAVAGLTGALFLGPRIGRYDHGNDKLPMGSATNALMGLFMLWWGWMGFNAGSTFGISGNKWKFASRASVTTILSSMGGGFTAMVISVIRQPGLYSINVLISGILASLVAITAACPLVHPWEAIVIGVTGSALTIYTIPLMDRLRIDDPIDSFAVHGVAGLW
ncbi:unnamed protein product, partial [Cyprideis torosa]